MLNSPAAVAQKLNELAPNIGLGYQERKRMIDPRLFLFGMFVLDITALGEWMESNYPEYRDKSLEQFLLDKDAEHINEWKELLGISE